MGYVHTTFPEMVLPNEFKLSCEEYINNYNQRYSILPSSKAISLASKKNNLLLYSEQEVDYLKSILEIDKSNENQARLIQSDAVNIEETIEIAQEGKNELEMLQKYIQLIFNPSDIKKLSNEERQQIKDLFRSEFYFIKCLKEYREEINSA